MSEAQAWLGKLLPDDVARDATHVAVVPMVAATEMEPGTHCGVVADGQAGLVSEDKTIGIVDPFLCENVKKGERFYLCLYPRSVTGLRHIYDHPALDKMPSSAPVRSHETSERWLRDYIERYTGRHDGYPTYEDVLDKIKESDAWGNSQLFHTVEVEDEARQNRHDDESLPSEFWDHVETVLGRRIHNRATHFACCT